MKNFLKKFRIVRYLWHILNVVLFKIFHPFSPLNKKNRDGVIIQLVSTFTSKDAIGNAVLEISNELAKRNVENYIAYETCHNVKSKNAAPISCVRFNKNDVVLYHMCSGCNCSNKFKKINVRKKIMYYHNITPDKYFYDMPYEQKHCKLGRKQLAELKDYTDLAICVSKYNEKELIDLGYKNTIVIPIPHRVDTLLRYKVKKEEDGISKLITVGRIARHKCIDDVIKVFSEYHNKVNNSKLYIIGNCINSKYKAELKDLINKLKLENNIVFLGSISEQELGYWYSNADGYICMSEHEGFCVPLIEAQAFGIPVFAYNSSAISETLKNGFIFNDKNYKKISMSIVKTINGNTNYSNKYNLRTHQNNCVKIVSKLINFM